MEKKAREAIFREKYDKYAKLLYRIAFLQLGDAHEAEDVLQEVFIKLLYKSPSFSDEEHEKAWLIRVTQNACKNILKSSARKRCEQLSETQANENAQFPEEAIDIREKIKVLPANYKTAIFLCYFEDYSVEQISKTLKISRSAVKMRLKRGRELLKNELEEYDYEQ